MLKAAESSLAALRRELAERQQLLDESVEVRAEMAKIEAKAAALMARRLHLLDDDISEQPRHRDAIYESMIAEYSAAGHLSMSVISRYFGEAKSLEVHFPMIRAALESGRITGAHVQVICAEAMVVFDAVRNKKAGAELLALYEAAVLEVAENDTPARTRPHARQVASALAGETLIERHERAASERSVQVRSAGDGLAVLTAILPEWMALGIQDRLTRMALEVRSGESGEDGEDERTLDQVRADLFGDLLLSGAPSDAQGSALDGIDARIQVTIAAGTLIGADEKAAELDGHGPLHPDIARDLAGCSGGWSRLFLDPTGMVVETDSYTPTEQMKRFLRARDQHCRFPGCRMPVHRCDIDHNHDYAKGGRTALGNLAHLCRRHHVLKHPDVAEDSRWSVQRAQSGVISWVSPLGRVYGDATSRHVMFV